MKRANTMSTITVELIIKMKTKFTSSNAEKTNGFISPQMSNFHIIDFTGSDLAEGQLSNGLCKTMDSDVFDRSRPLHSKGLSCLQVCR